MWVMEKTFLQKTWGWQLR